MEATVWARGWTLESVSDGLRFQERGESSLSGLVRLPHADWPDVRDEA
jgi:hypothetical protein